jgi:hypothetical protein
MNVSVSRGMRVLAVAASLGVAQQAMGAAGDGIRLGGGEGVLHAFVDVDARYDSNAYTTTTGGAADLVFHVRPGLKLDVPGDMIAIDALAAVERVQYAGLEEDTSSLNGWWADAGLRLSVNRKGRVGFELRDAFRRSNRAAALSLAIPALANNNTLSATLPFVPGGGALVFALGGDWAVESYEAITSSAACASQDCDADYLKSLGFSEVQARGSAIWKFLPRTKATFDAGYFKRLPNDTTISPELTGLRVVAGLSGLVTTQVGATLRAGYGTTFGDNSFGTWLATVEGEWLPVSEASVKAGYSHSIGTDPGRDFSVYANNRVFLDARYQFARKITVQGQVRYDKISYEAGVDTTTNVLAIEPSVDAEVTRWMRASVGYTYTDRSSTGARADLPTFNYTRNEVYIRASVVY